MLYRSPLPAYAALLFAVGCGYPTISYGTGGQATGTSGATTTSSSTGGAGGTGSVTTTSSSTTTSTTSATTTSSTTTSSAPACPVGHLLISEIRTRGPKGASDEFLELFNPTDSTITLDGHWTIEAQTLGSGYQYTTHWTGQGLPIGPRRHFLIVGSAFGDGILPDAHLSVGLTDAAGVRLLFDGTAVDAICFYQANDPLSATGFAKIWPDPYLCEGLPVGNPHNANETTDASLERRPGGLAGNCTDTNSNLDDWVAQSPSSPLSTKDQPTP
jgi:hypothetical protein